MSLQPWGGHGDLEPITLGTPGESSRGLKTPSTGRSRPPVKFQDLPAGLAPMSREETVSVMRWEDDRRSLWQWQCQAEQRLNELLQLEKDRGAAVRELRQDVRAMSRAVAILQEQVAACLRAQRPVEAQRLDLHTFRLSALFSAVKRLTQVNSCEASLRKAMACWSQLVKAKEIRKEISDRNRAEIGTGRFLEVMETLEGQAIAVQDLSELVRAELNLEVAEREHLRRLSEADASREEAVRKLSLRVDALEAKGADLSAVLLEARRMEQRAEAAAEQVQRRADVAVAALVQRMQENDWPMDSEGLNAGTTCAKQTCREMRAKRELELGSTIAISAVWRSFFDFSSVAMGQSCQSCQTGAHRFPEQGAPKPSDEMQGWTKVYSLGRLLGDGISAKVFEAEARDLVAIKRFHRLGSRTFNKELTALKRVGTHPNVLRLLESYQGFNREDVLVLEYCDGSTLYDLYAREHPKGGLPERLVARLLRQLFLALQHLSSCGVEHQDVKPENMMLFDVAVSAFQAELKLGDFGWAAIAAPEGKATKPPPTGAGSLWYAPPELNPPVEGIEPEPLAVDQHGEPIKGLSDMWSAGVVLYLLLVGHNPFNQALKQQTQEAQDQEVLRLVAHGRYNARTERWQGLHPDARDLVEKLLKVTPSQRLPPSDALQHSFVTKRTVSGGVSGYGGNSSAISTCMDGEHSVFFPRLCSTLGRARAAVAATGRFSTAGLAGHGTSSC
ncbi:unnamed protein product [Durusdinium trenchii]|uniref:Protein kinase domain-containing protein n=1 Tax=Durusdinium trenchii TaxID=1381693 RepID=A0ABP0M9H6_9DINO